jgi:formylglycine-generating enzyme required for sulfatase activity
MTKPTLATPAALALLASACNTSVETAPRPAPASTSTSPPEEVIQAPSCAGDLRCGDPAQSCCASPIIEGGSFNRYNNPKWPATVSAFRLDAFKVTVGRLRAFVEAYPGSRPKEGDGAHPKLASAGWRSEWDGELPETQEALRVSLVTPLAYNPPLEYDVERLFTWSDMPGRRAERCEQH